MTKPSAALIAHWYAKARASGFRDIEGGRDLNEIDGWTFRRAGKRGNGVVIALVDGFEPVHSLADHPTAIYHRGLEHAARVLTGQRRRLVLVASDGGAAKAGRAVDVPRRTASHQVRKFAVELGLIREARHGGH